MAHTLKYQVLVYFRLLDNYASHLGVGHLHFAPTPIDQVPIGEHSHLSIIRSKSDESKALGLTGFIVFLDLSHQHLAIALKVLP